MRGALICDNSVSHKHDVLDSFVQWNKCEFLCMPLAHLTLVGTRTNLDEICLDSVCMCQQLLLKRENNITSTYLLIFVYDMAS